MKERLFLIASILVTVAGFFLAVSALGSESDSPIMVFMGFFMTIVGFVVLVTGYANPAVAQSKEGVGLAYLMIVASTLAIIGAFDPASLWMLALIGVVLTVLAVFMWPCFCCSGKTKNRDRVIGVANAHDSIAMNDLSQITGISVNIVRDIIYDAIGTGQLSGKMEGDTFVRGKPALAAPVTITKEREVVKILVVCPFCGAKNEQGTPKCHNCKASL